MLCAVILFCKAPPPRFGVRAFLPRPRPRDGAADVDAPSLSYKTDSSIEKKKWATGSRVKDVYRDRFSFSVVHARLLAGVGRTGNVELDVVGQRFVAAVTNVVVTALISAIHTHRKLALLAL